MYFRTQVKIDLDALEYNFNNIKNKIGNDTKLLAVIKADAYGHDAVTIAKFLDDKCDMFGVACVEEAIELKKANIKTPVLVLGYVAPQLYDLVVKYDIRIPVFTMDIAMALSQAAKKQNKIIPFHFCVDTGMSRIGYLVNEQNADECARIVKLPNIKVEGIFSHYATADEKDLTKACNQTLLFKSFIKMLEDRGVNVGIKHINNSAGIMNSNESFDMCRMGIVLYGMYPSDEVDKSLLDIKPVMSWYTNISNVKVLPKNTEISYGGTYVTTKEQKIATVPVGYADGYPRSLSNIGRVIVNGKYANIVGRICMDQFMIDVTDIDDVNVGDTVILVGSDGKADLSMEEVANLSGSFNYELICRINRRVPRTFYKQGKLISYTNYLY